MGTPVAILGAQGGALGGGRFAPPWQWGASSRRRKVEVPTLVAAADPPDTRPTRSPKGSASIGSKLISTKSGTCANDATTVMQGVGQCSKTVVSHALTRTWCFYVHPRAAPRSPIPTKNSLQPSTHPVTQGIMGAGSLSQGHGNATGSGLCARDGQCRHPPAVAHMELKGGPRKCDRKRRAHVGDGLKSGWLVKRG